MHPSIAFKKDRNSTLQHNTFPTKILCADGDHATTSGSVAPARSISPVLTAVRSTMPTSLLVTPMESQSPSSCRHRTNVTSDSFMRSSNSSRQTARTASPSDNISSALSQTMSSGGGSIYSSDTGHSVSSSDYLTAPQSQADLTERPYKARRSGSESLSMMRTPKRASLTIHDKKNRKRRSRSRKGKCRHESSSEHPNQSYWSQSGCQVVPSTRKRSKRPCFGDIGRHEPRLSHRSNTATYGQVLPRLWLDVAPPVVSRRWSSAETGFPQVKIASTEIPSIPAGRQRSTTTAIYPRRVSRSRIISTSTNGAIDQDVVRTIQEKLTLRKVSSSQLHTPATITLRRASGASTGSRSSTVTDLPTPTNGGYTDSITGQFNSRSQADIETDTAYLITLSEINSITQLIEANLQRNYRPCNRISAHISATPPAPISSSNLSLKTSMTSSSSIADFPSYAPETSPSWTQSRVDTGSPPQRSAPEVIWEADGSPNSLSSSEEIGELKKSLTFSSSTPACTTFRAGSPKSCWLPSAMMDNENALNSKDWCWRLLQPVVPSNATFSESEFIDPKDSFDREPELESRPPIRSVLSAPEVPNISKLKSTVSKRLAFTSPEVEDVIIFPSLQERRTTSEWHSPLPNIKSTPMRSQSTRSLYDAGIDASGAIPTNLLSPKSLSHPRSSVIDRPDSPTSRVEFNPNFDARQGRHKSIIKNHIQAPARTGIQDTIGSSIGVSSGQRRRSSINPSAKRVRTIDHVNKGSRGGTWIRNRPPSVCPPPISVSSVETSDEENSVSPPHHVRSKRIDSPRDDTSPPIVDINCAGT